MNQNRGKGGGYGHGMAPNTKSCFFSDTNDSKTYTMVSAISYHPGGVNMTSLEGSVKFVNDSVNQQA